MPLAENIAFYAQAIAVVFHLMEPLGAGEHDLADVGMQNSKLGIALT